MKLTDIIFEQVDSELYAALDKAVPDETHYAEFAKAVASLVKNEYGEHLVQPFMEELHKALGINEGDGGSSLEATLKAEFDSQLGDYKPFVTMGKYHGSERQFGRVSFKHEDSLPKEDWRKAEEIIEKHGGKITNSANWYDMEPGERDFYPDIKFNIN